MCSGFENGSGGAHSLRAANPQVLNQYDSLISNGGDIDLISRRFVFLAANCSTRLISKTFNQKVPIPNRTSKHACKGLGCKGSSPT
jgi:hypothetical protein